jgi:hypothetical protein
MEYKTISTSSSFFDEALDKLVRQGYEPVWETFRTCTLHKNSTVITLVTRRSAPMSHAKQCEKARERALR